MVIFAWKYEKCSILDAITRKMKARNRIQDTNLK